jgi:hypothetical protein
MAKLFNQQKYTQRLSGLQISDTVYGSVVPLLWGRGRANLRMIWESNFQGPNDNGNYFTNGDFILCYGPMENWGFTGWASGAWFYPQFFTQNFDLSGPASNTWTVNVTVPSGLGFFCIQGVQLQTAYEGDFDDYVFPGQSNSGTLGGTTYLPLYNGNFPLPNNGQISNAGNVYPYALYNDSLSTQVTVQLPEPVAAVNFNVIFCCANQPSSMSYFFQLSSEIELGQGNVDSGQPIIYPEFSGSGGVNLPLGSTPGIPQTSFEMKGLFGMGNSGPGGSLVQGDDNQFNYNNQVSSGDCCPADAILDLVTSGNHIFFFQDYLG